MRVEKISSIRRMLNNAAVIETITAVNFIKFFMLIILSQTVIYGYGPKTIIAYQDYFSSPFGMNFLKELPFKKTAG